MIWTPLTENDILSGITQKERDDFAKTSVGTTVTDRLAPILTNMVAEIRGYIATWAPNTLSQDDSLIPPSFKANAISVVRWRMLITIPGYQPNDSRKLDFEAAKEYFLLVARGTIRPEPADDAQPTKVPNEKPSGVEIVSSRPSRTGAQRMDGI